MILFLPSNGFENSVYGIAASFISFEERLFDFATKLYTVSVPLHSFEDHFNGFVTNSCRFAFHFNVFETNVNRAFHRAIVAARSPANGLRHSANDD